MKLTKFDTHSRNVCTLTPSNLAASTIESNLPNGVTTALLEPLIACNTAGLHDGQSKMDQF
jgi:hypothetical protein